MVYRNELHLFVCFPDRFGKNVKVVHFIGSQKPWHYTYNRSTEQVEGVSGPQHNFLQLWWSTFIKIVSPVLKLSVVCINRYNSPIEVSLQGDDL